MQERPEPGSADLLSDEVLGAVDSDAIANEGGNVVVGDRTHDGGAANCNQVQPTIGGLQEHRRCRTADLNRIGKDRGRNIRVDADQDHLGIKPMLFEDALIDRDHCGSAVGGGGAADLDLGLCMSRASRQNRRNGRSH